MSKHSRLLVVIAGVVLTGSAAVAVLRGGTSDSTTATDATELATVVVYKGPECGCCDKWGEHLEQAGFRVKVKTVRDLVAVKEEYGIPPRLRTCHTAVVDGYTVEGHVPIGAIERLLRERPEVAGIVVPGMPVGSLGMEEGPPAKYEHYRVLTFDTEGSTAVFERH